MFSQVSCHCGLRSRSFNVKCGFDSRFILWKLRKLQHFLHSSAPLPLTHSTTCKTNIKKYKKRWNECHLTQCHFLNNKFCIDNRCPITINKNSLFLLVMSNAPIQLKQLLLRKRNKLNRRFSGDAIVVSCIQLTFFFRMFVLLLLLWMLNPKSVKYQQKRIDYRDCIQHWLSSSLCS